MSHKKKVCIVDDHKLFRDGLSSLLDDVEDIELIGKYESGESFLKALENGLIPDVCLLDLTMPGISGFDVLSELKKRNSKLPVLVLSMHDEGNYIVQSVRLMASGYLLKNVDKEELLLAIDKAASGKKYFGQDITEKMLNAMANYDADFVELSPRELEVLKEIAKGSTTKQIAEDLYVSTRTIETHRVNMMKKLNVKNSAELINKAISMGILT